MNTSWTPEGTSLEEAQLLQCDGPLQHLHSFRQCKLSYPHFSARSQNTFTPYIGTTSSFLADLYPLNIQVDLKNLLHPLRWNIQKPLWLLKETSKAFASLKEPWKLLQTIWNIWKCSRILMKLQEPSGTLEHYLPGPSQTFKILHETLGTNKIV